MLQIGETVNIGMNPDGSPREWIKSPVLARVADLIPGSVAPPFPVEAICWKREGMLPNTAEYEMFGAKYEEEFRVALGDYQGHSGAAETGTPWSRVAERVILCCSYDRPKYCHKIRFHVVAGLAELGVHISADPLSYFPPLEEIKGGASCFVEIPAEKLLGAIALIPRTRELLARIPGGQ